MSPMRIFIILSIVATYLFLLGPLVIVFIASLSAGEAQFVVFPPQAYSFDWYFKLPPEYLRSGLISVGVAITAGVISSILGVLAAFGIVRGKLPGKSLLRAYFNAPMQIPFVVTGIVFLQFYYLLFRLSGIQLIGTYWGIVAVHVFITLPYVIATVGGVLERFEPAVEEAARTLGASPSTMLWRVTLPMIKPGIMAGMVYAFVVSFGDVPATMFIVSSSVTTFPVQLFHALEFDYGPALLALSSVVMILSLLLIFIVQKVLGIGFILRGS